MGKLIIHVCLDVTVAWCRASVIRRMNEVTPHWSYSTLSPVSAGMGDSLRPGMPPWYVTKPTGSTQRRIPLGSLNWVPALMGWCKSENVTSAGWQVTLCDPICHVSSRSGEASCITAIRVYLLPLYLYSHTCTAIILNTRSLKTNKNNAIYAEVDCGT